jgi:hypothetical protein
MVHDEFERMEYECKLIDYIRNNLQLRMMNDAMNKY